MTHDDATPTSPVRGKHPSNEDPAKLVRAAQIIRAAQRRRALRDAEVAAAAEEREAAG